MLSYKVINHQSPEGHYYLVRVATVKISSGIYKRPIIKITLLRIDWLIYFYANGYLRPSSLGRQYASD